MSPELRARVREAAVAIFPESGRKDSRLVRAVLRETLPWLPKDEETAKRLQAWQVENGIADGAVETGSVAAPAPRPGRRTDSLHLRIEGEVRDRLKEAAVATRPEGSRKVPSGARVVREVLRQALGMPSTDGGVTLRRLAEWHERGGTVPAGEQPTAEDVESSFARRAVALLARDDPEQYDELDRRSPLAVARYGRRRAQEAMEIYREKNERLQRHLPAANAAQDAKVLVMNDHLGPHQRLPPTVDDTAPPSDERQAGAGPTAQTRTHERPTAVCGASPAPTTDREARAERSHDHALRSEFGEMAVDLLRRRRPIEYIRLMQTQVGTGERISGLEDYRRQKEQVAMEAFHKRLPRFAGFPPEQAAWYARDFVIRKILP